MWSSQLDIDAKSTEVEHEKMPMRSIHAQTNHEVSGAKAVWFGVVARDLGPTESRRFEPR